MAASLGYIVPVRLDREFKFRISSAMLGTLEAVAASRGEGSKIADLIREAIHSVYVAGYDLPDLNAERLQEHPMAPQKKKKRPKKTRPSTGQGGASPI
jgi:hypothetical protein